MSTRTVQSAEAKVNFGQLIDDVYSRGTRYIVQRFGAPRAVLISLDDYEHLLAAEATGAQTLREERASYGLGEERTSEEIAEMLNPTARRRAKEQKDG